MKTIRASEIGSYLFCHRAWWYERQGLHSENLTELASGTGMHARHERYVVTSSCLQTIAYILLLAALALLTVYLVQQFL